MNRIEWREFLQQYSEEFLSLDWSVTTRLFASRGAVIPEEARRSKWMGFQPASEAAISMAEERLGRRLPPSLRTFYGVSNGWGMTGSVIFEVLPVERIGWLKDLHPDLYEIGFKNEERREGRPFKDDADGARLERYCLEQGTMVKRSLAISSWGDAAVWLLDPGDRPKEGEWRGGCWASWNPAMEWTAESFAGLMQRELELNRDLMGQG